MDAYTFVFLRFLVASLIMLLVLLLTKNFSFKFNKKRLILFLGVINGLAYLLQYIGMVSVNAAESSLLINLNAVWVALLSPIVLKDHLGGKKVVGVMVSFLGVVLMTTRLDFASLGQGAVFGDLLVIAAGAIWAIFTVYSKPLVKDSKNLLQSMTWLLVLTLLPLLLPASFSAGSFVTLPLDAWLAILYTAVICWVIPYYLWMKGLKHLSPVTSSVVLLTEIIAAVIIATLVLGEVLTVISGVGALFIIVAILLVS
jgi:drug/metabolite transporter (DMT)-like permease